MGYVDLDTIHVPADGSTPPAEWGQQLNDNDAELWRAMSQSWRHWDPQLEFIDDQGAMLLEGYWHRVGREVTAHASYRFAADTTFGSGQNLTLPAPPAAGPSIIGSSLLVDSSHSTYKGCVVFVPAGSVFAQIVHDGATNNGIVNKSNPWNLGDGDEISISVTYRTSAAPAVGLLL